MSNKLSKEDRKELLNELEESYSHFRKEHKIKVSLEDVDKLFFVNDNVLSAGYVSVHLGKFICNRAVDTYMSWLNYLHNLIMGTSSMILMNEGKMLSEIDKKDILKLISQTMALVSENTVLGLARSHSDEAAFIDQSVEFWNSTFQPRVSVIAKKIHEGWKK